MVIDLTGQKFGKLTVLSRAENGKDRKSRWLCLCDCGNKKVVSGRYLRMGNTTSCGCFQREKARKVGKSNAVHGYSHSRLYVIWDGMLRRCNNQKAPRYSDYGGRGIRVCIEWECDFMKFREWALSNGYGDELSLDRIDVNGNYEPSNCRWATSTEQANNSRSNRMLTFSGKTQTMKQWADEYGINYGTLISRLDRSRWPIEKALMTPVRKLKNR